MKRLFAFGDSYTEYQWPMWPQILAQNFDITYSSGRSGAGNFYIFQKALQSLNKNNISSDDTFIIQWSTPTRVDAIGLYDMEWVSNGDKSAEIFRTPELELYNSDQLAVIKQLTYMVSLSNILDKIGCNWYYIFLNKFSMVNADDYLTEFNIDFGFNDVRKSYDILKNSLRKNRLVSTCMVEYMSNNFSEKLWKYIFSNEELGIEFSDTHPSPLQTLSWIENVLVPRIPDLNKNLMKKYATHTENFLDSVTVDGKYHPIKLHTEWVNFKNTHSYKNVIYE